MSQIKTYQHFVFKLHTQRLKKAGWSLSLTLADARRKRGVGLRLPTARCCVSCRNSKAWQIGRKRIYTLKTKLARAPTVPILSRRPTGNPAGL